VGGSAGDGAIGVLEAGGATFGTERVAGECAWEVAGVMGARIAGVVEAGIAGVVGARLAGGGVTGTKEYIIGELLVTYT
jgi:hypothetical protein